MAENGSGEDEIELALGREGCRIHLRLESMDAESLLLEKNGHGIDLR
jgi:hypothetical protein